MLRFITVLSSLLVTVTLAGAQSFGVPPVEEPADAPTVSVTFSPIHLVIPFGEVSAEINLGRKSAIAVIGGAGALRDDVTDDLIKLWEIGISPRYYVWGDFRKGVQLGAEAAYIHASASSSQSIRVAAEGLAVGPYVGAKWASHVGFTLEAQLGVQYLAIRGDGADDNDSRWAPLLNLQVGWSF